MSRGYQHGVAATSNPPRSSPEEPLEPGVTILLQSPGNRYTPARRPGRGTAPRLAAGGQEPASGGPGPMPEAASSPFDPLAVVRYLDVLLVLMAAPFVVLLGGPVLGYVAGAAAWIANRVLGVAVERYARGRTDVRTAVGLNVGALLGRAWLVGLTILAVGLAGDREDGLMAALLLLVAFTVYFATSLILRPLERSTPRR
jgi:hypothetical protein